MLFACRHLAEKIILGLFYFDGCSGIGQLLFN